MARDRYFKSLGVILAAALVLAAGLYAGMDSSWFGLYGLAAIVLVTLVPLSSLLWRRFTATGRSGWRALVYAIPAGLIALVQIGFWLALFTYGPTNPTLGVIRAMLLANMGYLLPWAAAILLAIWLWLFASASGTPQRVGPRRLCKSDQPQFCQHRGCHALVGGIGPQPFGDVAHAAGSTPTDSSSGSTRVARGRRSGR
jgi:uncharacterized membrane protein YhaH (DUF805 family)